jgi:hypothetical protein
LSHHANPVYQQPIGESKGRKPSDQASADIQPASRGRLIRGAYSSRQSSPNRKVAPPIDLDRRRTRTALVFRHHWNEIGRGKAGISTRG